MRLTDIVMPYQMVDFTTFYLVESTTDWEILESSAFKKGKKKYSNDKRVMNALSNLTRFITSNDKTPAIVNFPPEFYVHYIKEGGIAQGGFSAHLKGQKIIVIFFLENKKNENSKNQIKFVHLGTHQDVGWR